ncbi:P-loop containing nucleoside triphosphate hydrolase [Pseudocohnilembus persalinus]|uniref:p-loop containing nucleoside triphosphate hydrolase n=1 Tax=Pseudocohnilembus persalinus TaxID=266149 RepID=A0A0V0QPB9_PSEPJ|nr:P-loop containing nucleoside triphosphate hydrolase [Pseudocohnilembus persalinus]|eukprot:KRX03912.1 P-loop containing nucleoside triphosphate hydrolase [Pseudocohnilembus persalinus]
MVKILGNQIPQNVYGNVKPGEILYILGPSGSGKTTLLDYINNRTKLSPKNNVLLNQKKQNLQEFKKIAKYCQQQPQLFEILTVEQTLKFAASWHIKDEKQRQEKVETVLKILGLQSIKNVKIGGLLFRGISGGQKQRVSIGEQLISNPKLLFLDEPTSGLDSASAYYLMKNLQEIAQKMNIAIICSIHQPSQRIWDLSSKVLLLSGGKGFGGNMTYFGETKDLSHYIENIQNIPQKNNQSLSEYVLDLINGDFGEGRQAQQLIDEWKLNHEKNNQGNGNYTCLQFSIAYLITELPITTTMAILTVLISFFQIDYPEGGNLFWKMVLITCLGFNIWQALFQIFSYIYKDLLTTLIICSLITTTNFLFSGFLQPYSEINKFLLPLYYINPMTYQFQLYTNAVFSNFYISGPSHEESENYSSIYEERVGTYYLKDIDMDNINIQQNYIILIIIWIGFKLISHFYSYYYHQGKK